MGKPLSIDLRDRVLAFIEAGHSCRESARHFQVSASFVIKLMARVRLSGKIAPARQGRPPGQGKLAPFAGFFGTHVEAAPDITMPELAEALLETHGVAVTPAALSRFLIRQGYSYKKNTDRHRTRTRKGPTGARRVGRPSSAVDAA
jgi:transposase